MAGSHFQDYGAFGVFMLGSAWRGVAWRGVAWRGVAWRGVAWRGCSCRGRPVCGMPFGQITLDSGSAQNCYAGNTAPDGSAPADLEKTQPTCGAITTGPNTGGPLLAQALCDSGFGGCPAGAHYPKATGVVMHPLPKNPPIMSDPCQGVPNNPWCSGGKPN